MVLPSLLSCISDLFPAGGWVVECLYERAGERVLKSVRVRVGVAI